MATRFQKHGTRYVPSDAEDLDIREELPPGNYVIKKMPMGGPMYFERVAEFTHKGKVYGNTMDQVNRFLATFEDRPNGTGILLSGEKGSGKSLLAKLTAMEAINRQMPVFIINQDWHGEEFNQLIQSVTQPAVVMFDEFEKVYGREEQEAMLTLLDGTMSSKKLFIITVNDQWRINDHMHNRPGRLFYHLKFSGLDCDFITEYCQDNLKQTEHIEKICKLSTMFEHFNFDILKALVEEMNRYNESPGDALKMLNADPKSSSGGLEYTVQMFREIDGKEVEFKEKDYGPNYWNGNPLNNLEEMYIWWSDDSVTDEDDVVVRNDFDLTLDHLVDVKADTGAMRFKTQDGITVVFTKRKTMGWDLNRYLN